MLKINDGAVKGEIEIAGFEDWIELTSYAWGGSQPGSFQTGGRAGTEGKVAFQDLSVEKFVDASTGIIIEKMATGTHFDKIRLVQTAMANGQNRIIFDVVFEHVIVTSYMTSGGAGQGAFIPESVTFGYTSFKIEFERRSNDGNRIAMVDAQFNLRKQEGG
ncbi:hypothetical protein B2G71_03160 [Novosphingobium sp. PC22D]|uniref:Hcp family type VI secretion system effector n=1 Tax=Novosphingobium sp. PC22D TaxID=1962403 RepID=UPI000BFAC8CD|nr:type VI secretion system tube protein Hcp [Novosphingobium sp. PC22D]PEQ14583.1 hypothetical protein B2G71_03160 [Novosphingobium sp. PC22D]